MKRRPGRPIFKKKQSVWIILDLFSANGNLWAKLKGGSELMGLSFLQKLFSAVLGLSFLPLQHCSNGQNRFSQVSWAYFYCTYLNHGDSSIVHEHSLSMYIPRSLCLKCHLPLCILKKCKWGKWHSATGFGKTNLFQFGLQNFSLRS